MYFCCACDFYTDRLSLTQTWQQPSVKFALYLRQRRYLVRWRGHKWERKEWQRGHFVLFKCVSGPQAGWDFAPVRTHVTLCVCVCGGGGGVSLVPLKEASVAIMQDRLSHRNGHSPDLPHSHKPMLSSTSSSHSNDSSYLLLVTWAVKLCPGCHYVIIWVQSPCPSFSWHSEEIDSCISKSGQVTKITHAVVRVILL